MVPGAAGHGRPGPTAAADASAERVVRPLLTWADRLVLLAVVGLALVLLLGRGGDGVQGHARIEGADGFSVTVPLDSDATFEIPGPLGQTVAEIEGGSIRIVSSPCPHKMCVAMGAIDGANEMIVCVPNEVVVTIPGTERGTTDAVTR